MSEDDLITLAREPSFLKIGKNDYQVEELLGKGAYGEVWKALKLGEYEYCTIKLILTTDYRVAIFAKQEIKTLERLQKYLGKSMPFPQIKESEIIYDDSDKEWKCAIVTEFLDGPDLSEFVKSSEFNRSLVTPIIRQIILAVNLLHSIEIAHRDLKPENILIVKEQNALGRHSALGQHSALGRHSALGQHSALGHSIYRIVIIDFGLVCNRNPDYLFTNLEDIQLIDSAQKCTKLLTLGTLATMDPILSSGIPYLSFEDIKKTDLWSIGATLFYLLYRRDIKPLNFSEFIKSNPTSYSALLLDLLAPIKERLTTPQIIEKHASVLGVSLPKILQTETPFSLPPL